MNTAKAIVKNIITAVGNLPMGALIKMAIGAGVAVFTAYILIKRTKKMHEASQDDADTQYSPVDEILHGNNYAGNVDDFDDMTDEAKKICKKLNKGWRKGKKRKSVKARKRNKSAQTVSLFEDEDLDDVTEEDLKNIDRHFYKDATDMLFNEEKIRKTKKGHVKPNVKKRINDRREANAKKIVEEWKEFAGVSKETLLKTAKDLGLYVDDIDEEIDDEIREKAPYLF